MSSHFDAQIAASTFVGMITVVGVVWTLQSLIIWRAIENEGRSKSLAAVSLVLAILAGVTIGSSLVGLYSLAINRGAALANVTFTIALTGTFLFTGVVVLYYVLISLGYMTRQHGE